MPRPKTVPHTSPPIATRWVGLYTHRNHGRDKTRWEEQIKPFFAVLAIATITASPAFAADANSITIGFTASRTRPLNVDSLGQEHGFEFWRDEVNSKDGIQGRQ